MSTDELEARASTMGWLPKEKFLERGGAEDRWTDAESYIKRGEEILPLLQANNKQLSDRAVKADATIAELQRQLSETRDVVESLKAFNSKFNQDQVKDKKQELLSQLADAKREGDIDREVMLTDQLSEVNASLKEAAKAPTEKPAPQTQPTGPQLTPAAKEWISNNPWFGTDKRKTGLAHGISAEFQDKGGVLGTQAHFDYVDAEMAKAADVNAERRDRGGKTEGVTLSGSSSGGGTPRDKSFADLPAEAQKACHDAADRLVGPKLKYKTLADWQKRYVEIYLGI